MNDIVLYPNGRGIVYARAGTGNGDTRCARKLRFSAQRGTPLVLYSDCHPSHTRWSPQGGQLLVDRSVGMRSTPGGQGGNRTVMLSLQSRSIPVNGIYVQHVRRRPMGPLQVSCWCRSGIFAKGDVPDRGSSGRSPRDAEQPLIDAMASVSCSRQHRARIAHV